MKATGITIEEVPARDIAITRGSAGRPASEIIYAALQAINDIQPGQALHLKGITGGH